MPEVKKVRKSTPKGSKLLDAYGELARPNVTVSKMVLRVLDDGTVIVDECEYEEVVTTP
jgi:hypothetical protein